MLERVKQAKGQGDPACRLEICEWKVSGQAHQHQQEPLVEIIQSAKRNRYVQVKA
jgi:hypothetical protein